MGTYVSVAKAHELQPGQGKAVSVAGKTIALFNVSGAYYAIDDACPHQGGPLSEGEVNGDEVTCPWHASAFKLTTGAVLGGPATEDVATYRVRLVGEDVQVEV